MAYTISADVPTTAHKIFQHNYTTLAKSGSLFLFAGDQKIEHLNDDFDGPGIAPQAASPTHLFEVAKACPINAFAAPVGLITRYGQMYKDVAYVAKLNGKTNIIPANATDSQSYLLWDVDQIVALRDQADLNICGVGYTIYLGSMHEGPMLAQAAQTVFRAHQQGLIAILWIYPRGTHVTDPYNQRMLTGAAGLANALGADFVKLAVPYLHENSVAQNILKKAVCAAGNTKVICAGGPHAQVEQLLEELRLQHECGTFGCAIGRNLFQRSIKEAQELANAISQTMQRA